jgi:hypothetical protein
VRYLWLQTPSSERYMPAVSVRCRYPLVVQLWGRLLPDGPELVALRIRWGGDGSVYSVAGVRLLLAVVRTIGGNRLTDRLDAAFAFVVPVVAHGRDRCAGTGGGSLGVHGARGVQVEDGDVQENSCRREPERDSRGW